VHTDADVFSKCIPCDSDAAGVRLVVRLRLQEGVFEGVRVPEEVKVCEPDVEAEGAAAVLDTVAVSDRLSLEEGVKEVVDERVALFVTELELDGDGERVEVREDVPEPVPVRVEVPDAVPVRVPVVDAATVRVPVLEGVGVRVPVLDLDTVCVPVLEAIGVREELTVTAPLLEIDCERERERDSELAKELVGERETVELKEEAPEAEAPRDGDLVLVYVGDTDTLFVTLVEGVVDIDVVVVTVALEEAEGESVLV
jgi:hypothetical protein